MKPDRTNYEIWLIDYLDGKLDSGSERELFIFLEGNPDIMDEFSEMQKFKIDPPLERFFRKGALIKTKEDLTDSQYELLCIAASENDLNGEQKSEFEEIVAGNPEKRKIAEQIKSIRLIPPRTEFKHKSRLKRLTLPQNILRYSLFTTSAAAAVILIVTILWKPGQDLPENPILLTSKDRVQKENNITEPVEKVVIKKQDLVAENIKKDFIANDKHIAELVNDNIQAGISSSDTGSASSRVLIRTDEIAKIDYRNLVSFNNNEISGSLVAINLTPVADIGEQEKPGLNETIAKFFREKILKSETPAKGSLKGYEIADAGINGLNRLFGWEMSLEKNTDEKGEVSSVYFNSRLLKFNAPVKKNETLE